MMKGLLQAVQGISLAVLGMTAATAQELFGLPPAPHQIALDIKSQPMIDALHEWAAQTGLQMIVPEDDAADLRAPRIKGKFTPQSALERLLAGSPLMYTFIDEKTVAIRERYPRYVVENRPETSTLENLRSPATDVLLASTDEVTVIGSRLRAMLEDIRAQGETPTPSHVTVFNRERIDELGISTVSELLNYLPQQPYKRTEFATAAQHVEMRGLGVDTTLVLINGRRTIPSSNSVGSNAFDLNTLPLAAVERVEVLSDSASAVYGGDAVGGVVNVILKRGIPRTTLDLNYGAADAGADERRVAFSSGYSNDRVRTSIVLEYFDRTSLMGADRDRLNNADFRRFGSIDQRWLTASPGNISSRTAANLPGLPSRFAAVPEGSSGVGLTPADFLATAGQQNKDSLFRYRTIIPDSDSRSVSLFGGVDLSSSVTAFGEFLYVNRNRTSQVEPSSLTSAFVPATNPFNPFGVAVTADYLFTSIGPREAVSESELYRSVAGLRGAYGVWDWELSVVHTDDETAGRLSNDVDLIRATLALMRTDATQALNVFQDGPGGSPELLASLIAPSVSNYSSEGLQGGGILRGELFKLPAGAVEVVIGGEGRKEDILYDQSVSGQTTFVEHDRTVSAAFTELRLPLVSSDMQLPAMKGLSLTVAVRQDHYSDFGDTFNPQYAMRWTPMDDLVVRASYGTSFRAPSLFELFSSKTTAPGVPIQDPRRNNQITSVTFIAGGNPDLQPTEAESFTAGIVWTPSELKGLRLAAHYWQIEMDKRVKVLPFNVLLANEGYFPGRVLRAEPTPADIEVGLPGMLTLVDLSRINVGSLETSGIDFAAAYSFDTAIGIFSPVLSATWVDEYRVMDIPGALPMERVDIANSQGTISRWRAVATVGWTRQGVSLSATARYMPAYDDIHFVTTQKTGRSVASQTLLDLQGVLDLDDLFSKKSSWFSGLKLTAGVSNVFDEEPPFAEFSGQVGFDLNQGDLRQRFGYLKLSKSF